MKRVNEKRIDGNSGVESDVGSRATLIQMLIPIALEAANEELPSEVSRLAGSRYGRGDGPLRRWGHNPGSVCHKWSVGPENGAWVDFV